MWIESPLLAVKSFSRGVSSPNSAPFCSRRTAVSSTYTSDQITVRVESEGVNVRKGTNRIEIELISRIRYQVHLQHALPSFSHHGALLHPQEATVNMIIDEVLLRENVVDFH